MSDLLFLALTIAIAAAFAASAVWARQTGGQPRLWVAWAIWMLLLAVVCVRDWQTVPNNETPLRAYVLVSIVPTLAATVFVSWKAAKRTPLREQFIGAGIICWVLIPGMLLLGAYGLGG